MPRNVEIKARAPELAAIRARALALAKVSSGEQLTQRDVFFRVPNGRLKLRFIEGEEGQLIAYERDDQAGPKLSDFSVAPVSDPARLEHTLARALGVLVEVRKTRELVIVQQTRVHLDRVDGLGDFVELEVCLRDEQSVEEGQKIAEDLMGKLGIRKEELLMNAYADMLVNV